MGRSRSSSSSCSSSRSSSSRERRHKTSQKERRRSRSRDRSKTKKARRHRSSSRRRYRPERRRSRGRRTRSRSPARRRSRDRPARSPSREVAGPAERPVVAPVPVDVHQNTLDRAQRQRAIAEIDSSSGFQPASFVSSAKQKVTEIALPGEVAVSDLAFGTAVEPGVKPNRALDQITIDGLCHPQLFGHEAEKEERWIKHWFELRQTLMGPTSS